MAHGVNATSVFSVTVTDTNDHFLPDTAGGEDGYDVRQRDGETVVVTNDEDQEATVQLQGAAFDDAAMADAYDVGPSTTVAAGATEQVSVPENVQVSYLRAKVSFASAPSGNDNVTAKYHTDSDG
jgi:hypothetical protein